MEDCSFTLSSSEVSGKVSSCDFFFLPSNIFQPERSIGLISHCLHHQIDRSYTLLNLVLSWKISKILNHPQNIPKFQSYKGNYFHNKEYQLYISYIAAPINIICECHMLGGNVNENSVFSIAKFCVMKFMSPNITSTLKLCFFLNILC